MKTILYISTLLLFMSCGQKHNNETTKTTESEIDTLVDNSKVLDNNIQLKKYVAEGLLLNGEISFFDNNQKKIGKLKITEIEPTQIMEKSTKMFNIDGSTNKCQKAFFLKIKFKNKDYLVFGQDVYEIDKKQIFNTYNKEREKLTLFPIANFDMGASDEEGLTGCEEYSVLILFNKTKNHYSLIRFPENEDIHTGELNPKYAVLFNDDMAGEKIYKVSMKQDTLVIGIKATYQEGGSVFNLKTKLSTDFPKSEVSNRIRFDTDEELKKMDEIKYLLLILRLPVVGTTTAPLSSRIYNHYLLAQKCGLVGWWDLQSHLFVFLGSAIRSLGL